MLPHLVTAELFSVLLVFGRIGAALMLVLASASTMCSPGCAC